MGFLAHLPTGDFLLSQPSTGLSMAHFTTQIYRDTVPYKTIVCGEIPLDFCLNIYKSFSPFPLPGPVVKLLRLPPPTKVGKNPPGLCGNLLALKLPL